MKTLRLLIIFVLVGAGLLACATRKPQDAVAADSALKSNGLSEESKIRTAAVYYVIRTDLELSPHVEVFVSLNAAERALLASRLPRHIIRPILIPKHLEKSTKKVPKKDAVEVAVYNVTVGNQIAHVTLFFEGNVMYQLGLAKELDWSVRESQKSFFD
jgi:hypothetical protein